jgi:signal transduction histidine kinase
VANARLQAEIRARVDQVDASRRRLVEAADEQRRQLERDLRDGAARRLTYVAELLSNAGTPLADLTAGLDSARAELRELARGIHPATLTDHGLREAVNELAERSPVPVELIAPTQRFPPAIEAAAYFICSEALANATKHACASSIRIQITDMETDLLIEVADDGVGGADARAGSGLRGLADRTETLGGNLTITSPAGHGTKVTARLPLARGGAALCD